MLLRKKIPLTIILLIIIPLILLSITLYLYVSSMLIHISEERINEVVDIQSNSLDDIIQAQKRQVQITAKIHEMEDLLESINKKTDASSIEELMNRANIVLSKQLAGSRELETISLINTDGRVVASGRRDAINIDVSDREYFMEAMEGHIAVSNIHNSRLNNKRVIDIASPVRDQGENIIGILCNTINIDYFRKYTDNIKIGETGYAYIVDSDGVIISHPEESKIGKTVENEKLREISSSINKNLGLIKGNGTYTYMGKEKYMAYHIVGELNWILVVAQDKAEMNFIALTVFIIVAVVTVVLLIISIIVGAWFSKSITKPIQELTLTMDKAANGDLTVESNLDSKDEFGQLSDDFNIMLQKLNMSHIELSALYEQLGATEEELRAQYEELQSNQEALRNSEEKFKYMAYYDALTGLPNRTMFTEILENELADARKNRAKGAVLFIDLDNFKNVNDTLGHDYGDKLLELIANRLKRNNSDNCTICRFGGDEFIIIKPRYNNRDDVSEFAEGILKEFKESFEVHDKFIDATISIGIAMYPEDGIEVNAILKNADTAMYRAKGSGKNTYVFFNKEMYHGLEKKAKIISILKQAIKNNEFQLYYQPQFDINSRKIIGFEALIRLHNKELGFIPPSEFIPIAEEIGMINEIGRWCLYTACMKNKEWKDKGYDYDCIAVNISSIQFQQKDFLKSIKDTLINTGLKPEYLCIEITESVLMERLEENIGVLNELRNMGVKISLDDFGTGYSSLNYLRKMPIDELKMDKSFIEGICLNPKEESITEGIIQMAHRMELEVVAEGVEDEKQLMLLSEKSCDIVQGYLLSKPIPDNKAEQLLIISSGDVQKMASITLN